MTYDDTLLNNTIINTMTEEQLSSMTEVPPNQLFFTENQDEIMSLPVGSIFHSAIPQISAAYHLLDGGQVNSNGIYKDFCDLLTSLTNNGYPTTLSGLDEYAIDLDVYGQSSRFCINNTNSNIYNTSVSYKSRVISYAGYRLNSSSGLSSYSSSFVIFIPVRYGQKIKISRANAPLYNYIYETTNYGTSFTSLGITTPTFTNEQTYTVSNKNTQYVAITVSNTDSSTYDITNNNTLITLGVNSLLLPKITKFIEGLSNLTDIGKTFNAGLPNITGSKRMSWGDSSGGGIIMQDADKTGAFSTHHDGTAFFNRSGSSDDDAHKNWLDFDASKSNSIYGNSDTVQPKSIAFPYYIVLANVYKTQITVDIDNIVNDLNNKLNKPDAYLLVSEYTLQSDGAQTIQINGLNLQEDGGTYDVVFIGGCSSATADLYLNTENTGNYAYSYSGWYSSNYVEESPTTWTWSTMGRSRWEISRCQEWCVCHFIISGGSVNTTNNGLFYTAQSYSWGDPYIYTRMSQGLLNANNNSKNLTSLIFSLSSGATFNGRTSIKIYKRASNIATR